MNEDDVKKYFKLIGVTQVKYSVKCEDKFVILKSTPFLPMIFSKYPLSFPSSTYLIQTFVIHARHTSVRLFYCKFPITYLRNIAKHGAQYKNNVLNAQGVYLQHTKTYYLRDPLSRGDFFRVLARLISYLSSGKSRVSYLRNREDNPINLVLSFVYGLI